MGRSNCIVGLFVALLASPTLGQQSRGLRVFISVDMEGIAGIVTSSQLGPDGFDYPMSRKLMTGEANAAVEGALAAGAIKITVSDGHGNGLSILPDQLNQKASLIRSWPRPTGMSEGVGEGYDAVICIGYHASSNSPNAVLAHTFSGRYFEVKLNGKHATEAMAVAAVAGHYGVPVVLVAGDNVIVDEVHRDIDPNIVGVAVKRAIGMHSAESLSPEAAENLIRERTTAALKRLSTFHPFVLTDPVTLDLTLKNPLNAELLSFLPNVQREDGATIRFVGKDIVEVEKFLQVVSDYNPNQ